jgi:RNA-binding protein Nova
VRVKILDRSDLDHSCTLSPRQVSGVRIKISDRSDYVPGTRNRKVTLTGSLEAVQIAQFLISQKVQQSVVEMQSIPPGGRMS